jgi:hypothetical protein
MWLYEDLGFKQRLFCSPQMLADLIFPFYAEVVRFCHDHGMKMVLHTCGCTMEALPLIVEAGFDGVPPLEVAAGNVMFKAVEQYGDRLVFVGEFAKRIIETGDLPLIHPETAPPVRLGPLGLDQHQLRRLPRDGGSLPRTHALLNLANHAKSSRKPHRQE